MRRIDLLNVNEYRCVIFNIPALLYTLYHHHLMSLDMVTHLTQRLALPYILDHHYSGCYIKFEKEEKEEDKETKDI